MAKRVIFFDKIKTPPFETEARFGIGEILRKFQEGEVPGEPAVKPMHQIGKQCYEIRKGTAQHNWRVYLAIRLEIVVLVVEDKKRGSVSKSTIETCKERLRKYEKEVL